ncbi:hypothetical protein ZWY2020_049053 [Hordeum vulgare]|nr:hypothetical protein ZWY2020_049053 [Hordeum vulgare]
MSKRSDLLCILLLSLLAASLRLPAAAGSNRQLAVAAAAAAAARIGDEFLCQDPIGRPRSSSLMSSNAGDELSSLPAAAPSAAFTQEGFTAPAAAFTQEGFLGDKAFSSGDGYPKEDEDELLSGDGYAGDPHRSVEEEELLGDEEEHEDDLFFSVKQGAQVKPSSNNSEENGSSAVVQCPECGKLFRNDKSMFGHLRSHPNRGYKKGSGHLKSRPSRGYKPPARSKPLPSRNGKPSQLPSRNGRLSSPPVNDSRPVARYSQRDPELNRFEVMMAYVMLTVKQRGDGVAQDQSRKRKHESRELDVPEEDSVRSKAGDDVVLGDEHGTSVAEMPGDDAVHRSEQGDAVVRTERGNVEVPRKKGRKKSKESTEAHRKEKEVPSASTVKRPYTCKQCKAEFPTHQALGGHMAAHNKDKRIQAQNEQAAAAWEANQSQIDRSLNKLVTSSMKPAWEAHQSQTGINQSLNRQEIKGGGEEPRQGGGMFMSTRELLMERFTKLFNQGLQSRQEAGGSKRQHTEKKDGGSPSVAPPLTDGGRRRPFDIDLNVVAPEKE